jgi:(p)ppGpp synthase/HD superfamily hydrolase
MKLSEQFEEALIYATRAHSNQTRKKTGIPYTAHILGVSAIALEYGANETEARSARFFMIRWKIAVARNDCAIFGRNLAMM